jgi:hypothetical protein
MFWSNSLGRERGFYFKVCSLSCRLENGLCCEIKETAKLHFKLDRFSWKCRFKIVESRPFPIILGSDFLSHSGMVIDFETKVFCFWLAPDRIVIIEWPRGGTESFRDSYF